MKSATAGIGTASVAKKTTQVARRAIVSFIDKALRLTSFISIDSS